MVRFRRAISIISCRTIQAVYTIMPCDFKMPRPLVELPSTTTGCQFENEDSFTEFSGVWLCDFHLPYKDSSGTTSQKAGWDKARIEHFNLRVFNFMSEWEGQRKPLMDFTGVVFPGRIEFSRQWKCEEVSFCGAQFYGDAWFRGANFPGPAVFNCAEFHGIALFQAVHFTGRVSFHGAKFHRVAMFDGDPSFKTGNTRREADTFPFMTFDHATFYRIVSFQNRRFLANTSFKSCHFWQAPLFQGCTLHQFTTFPSSEFFSDTSSPNAVLAYQTLKLAMQQVRLRDEEAMFYALEQKSRRHQKDTPFSVKVFSYLYEVTADYGRSFMRPLYSLAAIMTLFFLVYSDIAVFVSNRGLDFYDSFTFTMVQVFRPFSVWLPSGGATIELLITPGGWMSIVLKLLATFQSLLSLSLGTLFLLALRRRFKLG